MGNSLLRQQESDAPRPNAWLAGLQIFESILNWLAGLGLLQLTEEEQENAGIYLGGQRRK